MVLLVIRQTQIRSCEFGNRIRQARRFRLARQKRILGHRLRTVLGVHAGRAEENQSPHTDLTCRLQHIELNGHILVHKVGGKCLIFHYSADSSGSENHILRMDLLEETGDLSGILKLQFAAPSGDQHAVSIPLQPSNDRRADKTGMTCDIYGGIMRRHRVQESPCGWYSTTRLPVFSNLNGTCIKCFNRSCTFDCSSGFTNNNRNPPPPAPRIFPPRAPPLMASSYRWSISGVETWPERLRLQSQLW